MPDKLNVETLADIRSHCTTNETGCWLWTKSTLGKGYAQITGRAVGRGQMAGHVLVFWMRHGRKPSLAMHTCDNPRCVNPDHIVEGTYSQNTKDAWARGRLAPLKESARQRMKEDRTGAYALGRSIGMPRGLEAMNGSKS